MNQREIADAIKPWEYIWTTRKDDYVLMQIDDEQPRSIDTCVIINVRTHGSVWLHDDELLDAIAHKLLEAGRPIIRREELPPKEFDLFDAVDGMSPKEIDAFLKRMQE